MLNAKGPSVSFVPIPEDITMRIPGNDRRTRVSWLWVVFMDRGMLGLCVKISMSWRKLTLMMGYQVSEQEREGQLWDVAATHREDI